MIKRLALFVALIGFAPQALALPATEAAADSTFAGEISAAKTSMMGRPETAYAHARRAAAEAALSSPSQSRELQSAQADWLTAEALTRLKRPNEAVPILDRTLQTVRRVAADTKLNGDVLKSRGRASASLGRVQPALADYQSAFRIYQRANEPRGEALALQEIGSIYADARDYAHVLSYYAQSHEVFPSDPALTLAAHNNRGYALKDLGRFQEAEGEFRQSLDAAQKIGSGNLRASILTNIAITQIKQGYAKAARATLAQALTLTTQDPEAAGERPFQRILSAKLEADAGHAEQASQLLNQAFKGVDLRQTPMEYRDFHEISANIYERQGDHRRALEQLRAFKRLDDQGRSLAASTNTALMAAQFDFANQDLRIVKLKAGQLERDMKIVQSQARARRILIGSLFIVGSAVLAATLLALLAMSISRNRIRRANAQLEVSNDALAKALRAKTDFLATTSHEIRTPLNGILGMAQVMLADRNLQGSTRERLQLLKGAGETMKSMVDDLLDVAKGEASAVTLAPSPVDLASLLNKTCALWTVAAEAKGLTLILGDVAALPWIVADGMRLEQLLSNLLSNAIKFTESGSVTLKARVETDIVVFDITDTGIGIPDEDAGRIFDAFTQVDTGTSRRYGGTGLGLSICRNICAAMGGQVSVQSRLRSGSTFTVRLPLVEAVDLRSSGGAETSDLAAVTVLLLEANPLVQRILTSTLAGETSRTYVAASLADAHEQLASSSVDIILADGAPLRMDSQGVTYAIETLRRAAPKARLILTWPRAEEEASASLLASGADRVVLKPATPADLLLALKDAWSRPTADLGVAA